MSEMTSDQERLIVAAETMRRLQVENERLRRFSVQVFEACPKFGPHANCPYSAGCVKGFLFCNKCGFFERDPSCDGTGRVLKDGVQRRTIYKDAGRRNLMGGYWFPASMVEGEEEEGKYEADQV